MSLKRFDCTPGTDPAKRLDLRFLPSTLLFCFRTNEYPAAQNGNPHPHLLGNYRGAAYLDYPGLKRERLFNIPAPAVISGILRIIGGKLDQLSEIAVQCFSRLPIPLRSQFLFYSFCQKYLQQRLIWNIPFIRQQFKLS